MQNEKQVVPTAIKIELIERLAEAGVRVIEATSFVSPKWVPPQMGDNTAVLQGIQRKPGVTYTALSPNFARFDGAVQAGANEVAIFGAASESFSRKNINCSIAESLKRFEPVVSAASALEIPGARYVSASSAALRGAIAPEQVASVAQTLFDMGCYEVSLGDTIGVGNPASVQRMIEACARRIPIGKLAGHYHDTYGMAIANIYASLQSAWRCSTPRSPAWAAVRTPRGASGNVATEDVVYLLDGLGIETGIDLAKLAAIGDWISTAINRPNGAKGRPGPFAPGLREPLFRRCRFTTQTHPPRRQCRPGAGPRCRAGRPMLKHTAGFEKRLAGPVQHALGYCAGLVAHLPGPIDINRHAFANDPLIHALFATADDIDQMLGRSRRIRDFLSEPCSWESDHFTPCSPPAASRRNNSAWNSRAM